MSGRQAKARRKAQGTTIASRQAFREFERAVHAVEQQIEARNERRRFVTRQRLALVSLFGIVAFLCVVFSGRL